MITPLYAGLLGLMLIGLSVNVIRGRTQQRIGLGDGGQMEMQRRMRAQANLAEYAPLFLILLGYAEYHTLPAWATHGFGLVFLAGRVMHAYSLLKHEQYTDHRLNENPLWRIRGMMCTFGCIGILSLIALISTIG